MCLIGVFYNFVCYLHVLVGVFLCSVYMYVFCVHECIYECVHCIDVCLCVCIYVIVYGCV